MATVLKQHFPSMVIGFMGKHYTRAVIEACASVDVFIDVEDFMKEEVLLNGSKPEAILHVFPVASLAARARELQIPLRVGTTNRLYHWVTCNKMVRFSRKSSDLHEAQLNLKLLKPFGIEEEYTAEALGSMYAMHRVQALPPEFQALVDKNRYNLILHPKSQGSGREWPLSHYIDLAQTLDPLRYKIFVSGTEKERGALHPLFKAAGNRVVDLTGAMSLPQFIAFIAACDGLVASGTGPIHLAAALGRDALGIYPPIRPVHPGRWRPLGPKATIFALNKDCNDCKTSPPNCSCMQQIAAAELRAFLENRGRS
jgi:ADP-heptose:LPS heptosyltransferase